MCLQQLDIGGVETAVLTLCKGYIRAGHNVFVAAKPGIYSEQLKKMGVKLLPIEYEIENRYSVYSASTRRSAYETSKLVKFAKDTTQILGNYTILKEFDILSARLYYGVRDDIIPLVVGVKRLGRKRARNLVNIFGNDLSGVSQKELQKIEGIGPKLAEKIRIFAKN